MKKENSTNSRKCFGQKNLGTSGFEIPEISLAQLILEQFTVNKETYKILKVLKFIWAFLTVPYHETKR